MNNKLRRSTGEQTGCAVAAAQSVPLSCHRTSRFNNFLIAIVLLANSIIKCDNDDLYAKLLTTLIKKQKNLWIFREMWSTVVGRSREGVSRGRPTARSHVCTRTNGVESAKRDKQ